MIHIPTAEAYNQVNQTHQDLYLYIYCDGKALDLAIISYSVGIETPSSLLTNQIIQDTSDLLRTLKIFLHCGPKFSTVEQAIIIILNLPQPALCCFFTFYTYLYEQMLNCLTIIGGLFFRTVFVFRLGTTHL